MKTYLHLKKVPCWKCSRLMTVAWATTETDDGAMHEYLHPGDFDEATKHLAQRQGVILEKMHSNTTGEDYVACICPHCGAFMGDHFLFKLVYCQDETFEVL